MTSKTKTLLSSSLLFFFSLPINAQQAPAVVVQANYGGEQQEAVYSLLPTADNSFMLGGTTDSKGAGKIDAWLVKADSEGKVLWDKTFGGAEDDVANDMIKAHDGGYILAGYTQSQGAGNKDCWLLKVDDSGKMLWEKTFGTPSSDAANQVVATADGGYLLVGTHHESERQKKDGIISLEFKHFVWILKTDADGNELWRKSMASDDMVSINSLIATNEGGFAVVANTKFQGEKYEDIWVLKLDKDGEKQWDKVLKGESVDVGNSILQSKDGGYFIGGASYESGGGNSDAWLVKLDKKGKKVWDKNYGGKGSDQIYTMLESKDGGYLLGGISSSGEKMEGSMWLLKTDAKGKLLWETTVGKDYFEQVEALHETADGKIIVAGFAPTRYVTETMPDETAGGTFGDMRFLILK